MATQLISSDWVNAGRIIVTMDDDAVVKVGQQFAGTTPVTAAVVFEDALPAAPSLGQSTSIQVGPPMVVRSWNRTTGAWVEHTDLAQSFDVTAYGATGGGVTADNTAIGAAITAAPAGSTIWFPTGQYLLDAGLTVAKRLVFDGPGELVQGFATSDAAAMLALTADRSEVHGLTFTGADTAATYDTAYGALPNNVELYSAISATGDNCTIEGVTITSRVSGVSLVGATDGVIRDVTFTGITGPFSNPTNYHTAAYISAGSGHVIDRLTATVVGSGVLAGDSTDNLHVTHCTITATTDNGIYLSSAGNSRVTNNRISDSTGSGIKARGSHNDISHNTIDDVSVGVSVSGTTTGIIETVWGGESVHVTHNDISACTADGILISEQAGSGFFLRDVKVIGNTIIDTVSGGGGFGAIRAIAEWITIHGNTVKTCGSTVGGIIVAAGGSSPAPEGVTVAGNTIDDTTTDGIRLVTLDGALICGNTGDRIGNNRFIYSTGGQGSDVFGNFSRSGRVQDDGTSDDMMHANNTTPLAASLSGTNPRTWA